MTRKAKAKAEGTGERRGYHHGDLRHAMIEAAEAVLAENGIGGLTLRECARRAGVSPAAPAHHFGNLAGLLTAVATLGFDDLATAMEEAACTAAETGEGRLAAIGRAYLATALARPGRFRVVFGRRELNKSDPELQRAAGQAFAILVREVRMHRSGEPWPLQDKNALDLAAMPDLAEILLAWSVPHGFALLLIDGQLDFLAGEGGRDRLVALFSSRVVALLAQALPQPRGLAKSPADD